MARAAAALAVTVLMGATTAAAGTGSSATIIRIELRGFGHSLGLTTACPNGLTRIPIRHSDRHALDCVLTVRRETKPGIDPWRISEDVRVSTQLAGGTLRTRETQVVTFDQQHRSRAVFSGRIVGGTGRFTGARGTVSGGGPGYHDRATWRVTFNLR